MADSEFNKVPKFLRRLYREVSDPDNKCICWDENGEKIRIVNKEMFVKDTLPKLSKTKEYSGFIRQLNIYGFIKIKNAKNDDTEEYYNCFFKKNDPECMEHITRIKKHTKEDSRLNQSTIENNLAYLTNSNYRLNGEIAELRERVEKQERTINGLLEILGKVFRTGMQNISYENNLSKLQSEMPSSLIETKKNSKDYNFRAGFSDSKEKLGNFISGKVIKESDSDENHGKKIIKDMSDIFF